jgi:hypothetical protein
MNRFLLRTVMYNVKVASPTTAAMVPRRFISFSDIGSFISLMKDPEIAKITKELSEVKEGANVMEKVQIVLSRNPAAATKLMEVLQNPSIRSSMEKMMQNEEFRNKLVETMNNKDLFKK